MEQMNNIETAVFGGGCFWCLEAVFLRLRGVASVRSGYAGGTMDHPSYEDVSSGETGHAEVIEVTFDPSVITYNDLLNVFFSMHDPTTLNRQGHDFGTQYRSALFYTSEAQKEAAQAMIDQLTAEKVFENPIVTELAPLKTFYPAESYHEKYYDRNPNQGYCQAIISPKIAKLREKFKPFLKETAN